MALNYTNNLEFTANLELIIYDDCPVYYRVKTLP